ncbi:bifunctional phosphoribosyl-AMP cyclohydrolase/phosphoribosyl-ATP diphosphatase HisIE [Aegicerativicinus sediminis]|uniref:bifunctional phosphoribosyl-AMP cyclohydrolase/phosphoribosyl-ATP diphosphatase HisIE n=1 Tax=Aegicerativicinus sediminis TaxID=2893202 RepID=UPI001E6540C7|nr:bifunctional phosphoribosyl-AMP cyclohydrolase/phosphoribosyl-ATP diphosphatase HisIE [Aegicerativicinus sediminis]
MKVTYDDKGLVPAIIQDFETNCVLMLGYMNEESLKKTQETKLVTFFSRSKNRLWTKGEESGNVLHLISIESDCDNDTLLVKVKPDGPTCHTGSDTCWGGENVATHLFVKKLERIINDRLASKSDKPSYVRSLFDSGINKIAQKVGEEAVETIIEAKDNNDDLFLNESADLFFHYLLLLNAKGFQFSDVLNILESRHTTAK